jgi:uncharacterized protein (DUF169 family)
VKLQRFAAQAEEAHAASSRPDVVPLWGSAAAAARLYRDLCHTEGGLVQGAVVVSLSRHFGGRRA